MTESRKYEYWLLANSTLTSSQKRKLYEYFEGAYELYNAKEKDILKSFILSIDELDAFLRHRASYELDKEYETLLNSPFNFVTQESDEYPESLNYVSSPVYGLFYTGNLKETLNKKKVAIVGARGCSAYGKRMAHDLGYELGKNNITVVSGLAKGIDSYSHQGCIDAGGTTAAVLGCGVDVVYPKENAALYESIAQSGCILSEYGLGHAPQAGQFPARNRFIAGLSTAIVVVEARLKSGSLITADLGLELGKDIYVVPGRIGDSLSAGCNRLASQGAGIIFSIEKFMEDILELSKEELYTLSCDNTHHTPKVTLTKEQLIVYSLFDLYPKSLSSVQPESGMDYLKLMSLTIELTRMGLLKEVFKNSYIIT
ncbi:MAG: DNA-protecting protein DprA [Pseudobutyrivibrio sp.]|nr:DNA-protecting protein DprA [Pseudobutyrivibrio sp.]